MAVKTKCRARQYSDQMVCAECVLAWDVNDPDPPKCKTAAEKAREEVKRLLVEPIVATPKPESAPKSSLDEQVQALVRQHPVSAIVIAINKAAPETIVSLLGSNKENNNG